MKKAPGEGGRVLLSQGRTIRQTKLFRSRPVSVEALYQHGFAARANVKDAEYAEGVPPNLNRLIRRVSIPDNLPHLPRV